jgi:hypothetical protein
MTPSIGASDPNTSLVDRTREAFTSRLYFVLQLAARRDDRLTIEQARGLVKSLEAYLDAYLKELFSTREPVTLAGGTKEDTISEDST